MHLFKKTKNKKNKCYISLRNPNEKLIINEIKLKDFKKIDKSKGYILNCILNDNNNNSDTIKKIINIDKEAYDSIKKNNQTWFNNKLEDEEINKLYISSYDNDNSSINLILSINNPINIIINGKNIDDINVLIEILSDYINLKKYIINVEISHLGLYFYPKISSNKWIIKTINLNNYEDEDNNDDNNGWFREDVENGWEEHIQEINDNIQNEIKRLENLSIKMNEIFNEIKEMKYADNNWQNKLDLLKSIIISPNNRILSIYDNR